MNRTEKKAYEILKSQGYRIEKPVRVKFHSVDLWNAWDFACINEKEVRLIQVSSVKWTNRPIEYREKLLKFPKPPCVKKEYWFYNRKTKQFEITQL
jgi:hypothetical protein